MKQPINSRFYRYLPLALSAGITTMPCTTTVAKHASRSVSFVPFALFLQTEMKPPEARQETENATNKVSPPASTSRNLSLQNQPYPYQPHDSTVTLNNRKFNLAHEQDWEAFLQTVRTLREQAKAEKKAEKKKKKEEKKEQEAPGSADHSQAIEVQAEQNGEKHQPTGEEKPRTRKGGRDWSSKKVRTGLDALDHIAQQMQADVLDKDAGIHAIQEICWAVESNFRTPYVWRESIDWADALLHTRYLMLNACGRGNAKDPATNLPSYDAPDLSKVNPLPSPFWTPPGSIAAKDLYAGFNRPALPDFSTAICDYDSPHKGYGIHPSFEAVQNGQHWKVKFGNEHSTEPFACRIFWALGFPVEIVDYAPLVKVHWDRRILTDFNARKENVTHIKFAGIHLLDQRQEAYYNPFDYIRYAILKDGSRVEVLPLRERLLPLKKHHSHPKHPEQNPSLYDTEFEQQIDYLVMQPASFSTAETEEAQEVGYWDYNYLEHPKRRELRGMGILDAWLENYDVRWGNNTLRLIESSGNMRYEPIVSDLGGIFGQSAGLIRARPGGFAAGLYGSAPNEYGWMCTHPQPAGKTTVPIQDYMPITKIQPFYEMNLDDARWMARMIAQFTEPQLKAALIAAGYDAPEARILLEKLVSRRDRMIQDLGLSGEIAPLRPSGVNKHLSYNAHTDGPFEVSLADGRKLTAQDSGEMVLVNGQLKLNPQKQHP